MGILAGLIGWVITGVLVSINLAGPAYRVTVPSCVLIATLRLKLKAEQEVKQKAEREANKTKRTWYLAIIFLIGLAILAVFFIKREHQPSNNPNNSPKSGVKKLKNPSHKKPQELKNSNNRSN
ncbi:flagellar biosynthesis protein FlgG [Helicobacter pylori]